MCASEAVDGLDGYWRSVQLEAYYFAVRFTNKERKCVGMAAKKRKNEEIADENAANRTKNKKTKSILRKYLTIGGTRAIIINCADVFCEFCHAIQEEFP